MAENIINDTLLKKIIKNIINKKKVNKTKITKDYLKFKSQINNLDECCICLSVKCDIYLFCCNNMICGSCNYKIVHNNFICPFCRKYKYKNGLITF